MLINSELLDAYLERRSTIPSPAIKGRIYYDTLTDLVKLYDGTNWREFLTADQVQSIDNKVIVAANNTITTAAIGNLTSTELNAALAELQADIDTRATDSDFSAHESASSGVHGVVGQVLGTTDAQSVSNKTLVVANNTVTTAASGNLTSTELNAALAELQSDIDIRATSSDLTSHENTSSGAHGVTGDVVGTLDAQVLFNKTLESPEVNQMVFGEQGLTPPAPGSGLLSLYAKDDKKLYTQNSDGEEIEVGSGAGSAGSNLYVLNPDAEINLDNVSTSWVPITLALETTSPLAGDQSFKITSQGPSGSDRGWIEWATKKIDAADIGQLLYVSAYTRLDVGSAGAFEIGVVAGRGGLGIVDIPETFQDIPAGIFHYECLFTCPSDVDTSSYALFPIVRDKAATSGDTVVVDRLSIGPEQVVVGSADTEWESYTPAFFGTTGYSGYSTTPNGFYKRDATDLLLNFSVRFSGTSVSTDQVAINIPVDLTVDADKLATGVAGIDLIDGKVIASGGSPPYSLRYDGTTNTIRIVGPTFITYADLGNNGYVSFQARVPIAEWAGATQTFANNRVEYASVGGTWDADSSTTIYGPDGSAVGGALTYRRIKTVTWQTPTTNLHKIALEFSKDRITWVEAGSAAIGPTDFPILNSADSGATSTGGAGVCYYAGATAYETKVKFSTYILIGNDDTPAVNWPATDGYWRLRRTMNPLGIGTGLATATQPGAVPSFEEIDETVSGPYAGDEVTNVTSIRAIGTRIGNTYNLVISFNFNLTTGNNVDGVSVPLSQFSFLSGKTVNYVGGNFISNVNEATTGKTVDGYYSLSGTDLRLEFFGQYHAVSNRQAKGTVIIKVD